MYKNFDNPENIICNKSMKHTMQGVGIVSTSRCQKIATHSNGAHSFCRKHAKIGRFVARIGDIGEILARFDTEQQLRNNIHLFPKCRMQKITSSHRKDIY
jgi:hypothetical protein